MDHLVKSDFTPSTEYFDKAQKLKTEFDIMFSETDWESITLDSSLSSIVTLEKKHYDNFILDHYRATTTVDTPKEQLVEIEWTMSLEEAQKYESNISEYRVLEEFINPLCKIKRQVNTLPTPLYDRETIFIQYRFDEENATYYIGFSIDYTIFGLTGNFVRTSVPITAFKFTAINDKQTLVQKLINADPNGYIPKFVIDSQAHKLAEALAKYHTLD